MPYLTRSGRLQRSRSIGHAPIVENEQVKQRLQSYRILAREPVPTIEPSLLFHADALGSAGDPTRWVISFDGSSQEVAAREEYPSTRVGYVQIAGVLVHLDELLSQQEAHLVDPAVIHGATDEALYSMVLPGSNVCRPDAPTVRHSWRAEIYDIFRDRQIEDSTLLHLLMGLIRYSDKSSPAGVVVARCPYEECSAESIDVPAGGRACPSCGGHVFPTDVLRIHEEVWEEGANSTSLGRLMTVLEHVSMAAYLDLLRERQARALGSIAFILDGPLALFGPQAWLHTAVLALVHGLGTRLASQGLRAPVIIGIEKSGLFAEHAAAIADRMPTRHLMVLPDSYIYNHILTFRDEPNSFFGRDTYYGQKFLYKTTRGQVLVITVPKPFGPVADPHSPAHYPGLPDTLALLDRIGTSLYENAVIPVALAHSYASIPLRTGSRVLTLLSRNLLGLEGQR